MYDLVTLEIRVIDVVHWVGISLQLNDRCWYFENVCFVKSDLFHIKEKLVYSKIFYLFSDFRKNPIFQWSLVTFILSQFSYEYSFIAENEMERLFVTGSTSLLLRLRLRKTDSGNDTNWIKYSHYIQSPERNKKLGDELNVV